MTVSAAERRFCDFAYGEGRLPMPSAGGMS